MAASDRAFSGPIPALYDRLLVPLVFEPYARDLSERVRLLDPDRVLEVAAGTGALTRELAACLSVGASLVATDLSPAMLDRAWERQAGDPRIEWQSADALSLPFDRAEFDLVCCQFGAMFFPDRAAGFAEMGRVLHPSGTLVFNVWGPISENVFASTVSEAVAAFFPADPPDFMARLPYGYGDEAAIRADLAAAGFRAVAIETVERPARAGSARDVAVGFCQGTPLRLEIEARDSGALEAVTAKAEAALAARFGAGAIEGATRARVVTARP